MNKIQILIFLFILLQLPVCAQSKYNLDLEIINSKQHLPEGWYYPTGKNGGYKASLDSVTKHGGKYALKLEDLKKEGEFGACLYQLPAVYYGSKIKLTGYLKTENVAGFAGIMLRIDGNEGVLAFDNMQNNGVKGTTDWQEYTITLDYNAEQAQNIIIGAVLSGKGIVWMDDLKLYIDDKEIDQAPVKKASSYKASVDTTLNQASGIAHIQLNKDKTKELANLGMTWGFLKYYHPAIARGDYNWDAELFRLLPDFLAAKTSAEAYAIIEQRVDSLGAVEKCTKCKEKTDKAKLTADYGYLFQQGNLPSSLMNKLAFIRDNHEGAGKQFYVQAAKNIGNAVFVNELPFNQKAYPDAGVRLLALFRYWNMIQYFYPYRGVIGEDWNKVLTEFIPRFVDAKNEKEYTLACLELIAKIHDTHANIWSENKTLDELKGQYVLPLKARFVENKLVVTGYTIDTLEVAAHFKKGDIIEKIDGTPVAKLVAQYLPWTPASNYETQLRDMSSTRGFLLRSNTQLAHVEIRRGGSLHNLTQKRIALDAMKMLANDVDSAYSILPGDIGYIYPALLEDQDIHEVIEAFQGTKGVIIDMRCYPSTFMPFTYGQWLKCEESPFVKLTTVSMKTPGTFVWEKPIVNGEKNPACYPNKVVILVNERTQSQAEYTTMALGTAAKAIVVGSKTAGADGNVSQIILPGGITTMISGIGVYYPDGTETQRIGVKIQKEVKPTIKGIEEGKDEVLDYARNLILNGK